MSDNSRVGKRYISNGDNHITDTNVILTRTISNIVDPLPVSVVTCADETLMLTRISCEESKGFLSQKKHSEGLSFESYRSCFISIKLFEYALEM